MKKRAGITGIYRLVLLLVGLSVGTGFAMDDVFRLPETTITPEQPKPLHDAPWTVAQRNAFLRQRPENLHYIGATKASLEKPVPRAPRPSLNRPAVEPKRQDQGSSSPEKGAVDHIESEPPIVQRKPSTSQDSLPDTEPAIARAQAVLIEVVRLVNPMHDHDDATLVIPIATRLLDQLTKIETFLEATDAVELKKSGLVEKIAAVKTLVEEAVAQQEAKQVPRTPQKKLPTPSALEQAAEQKKALEEQARTYLSDPLVREIATGAKKVENTGEQVLVLEALALRTFSLQQALETVPADSEEKVLLTHVNTFELQTRATLAQEKMTVQEVQARLKEVLGDTLTTSVKKRLLGTKKTVTVEHGALEKVTEKKISFLLQPKVMNSFDKDSKLYVRQAIEQFRESLQRVKTLLLQHDGDINGSLEKIVTGFLSGTQVKNAAYDRQNELYTQLYHLQKASSALGDILTGMSLTGEFARTTYLKGLNDAGIVLPEDVSDAVIAQELKNLLSPKYALSFVDADKTQELTKQRIGQNLCGEIGANVLDLPKDLVDEQGYVVSTADAQRIIRNSYEAVKTELGITLACEPENWDYISREFLQQLGDAWLRTFTGKEDSVTLFKKQKLLCDAWQYAQQDKVIGARSSLIFRQMGAEFFSYPQARNQVLTFLQKGRAPQGLSIQEKINASRVHLGLTPLKIAFVPAEESGSEEVAELKNDLLLFKKGISYEEAQNQMRFLPMSQEDVERISENGEALNALRGGIKDLSLAYAVDQAPQRAAMSFLETMQPALSDPDHIHSLMSRRQLPFVLKELSAFQTTLLEGRAVSDPVNSSWQVELYQRAQVFKQAIHNLDVATSHPSAEQLEELAQRMLKRISRFATLDSHILKGQRSAEDVAETLRYLPLQAIEGELFDTLRLKGLLTSQQEEAVETLFRREDAYRTELWQQRFADIQSQMEAFTSDPALKKKLLAHHPDLLKNLTSALDYYREQDPKSDELKVLEQDRKDLLAYQAQVENYLEKTEYQPKIVGALTAEAAPLLAARAATLDQAAEWEKLAAQWQKKRDQKTLTLGDFAAMAEQLTVLIKAVYSTLPETIEKLADLSKSFKQYDPHTTLTKELDAYRVQLSKTLEQCRRYETDWHTMLEEKHQELQEINPYKIAL